MREKGVQHLNAHGAGDQLVRINVYIPNKLNTDENQDIASQYGIQGIPTLLFIKDGKEVDRLVGVSPKPIIQKKIDALL